VMTALSIQNTTFIARGFSGNQAQLTDLLKKGIQHANSLKGFAFIEVLSPCVTYNDTYKEWREQVHNLDAEPSYSPKSRVLAFTRAAELLSQGKIPTGLIFTGETKSLETNTLTSKEPMALQNLSLDANLPRYEELLKDFR
jgi:2-oxoglutarate/2-oxoacid ferredoxin oxidoreductase subunit beta